MDDLRQLATLNDSLLACCLCRNLLQDAVQLTCLHNCCRRCFNATASQGSSRDVACTACGTITREGTEQANGFIEREVRRYAAISESRLCGVCRENGELDRPASVWCPECRHSLCDDCIVGHRQYYRQHISQPLEELKSLDGVRPELPTSMCPTHVRPLDIACLNCEQAKCIICWADCKERKHEMHIVGNESFDVYVSEFVACIASMESELLQKSAILEKPKSNARDIQVARAFHLEQINQRKSRIGDAAEVAYQKIEYLTKNAYDDLEKEAHTACAEADGIASNVADARSYIRRLVESNNRCEILNQQKIVRERLRVLSAELDTLSDKLGTVTTSVPFEHSLPSDWVNVIQSWIGMPQLFSVAASSSPRLPVPQQHFSFSTATASVQLPVQCWDVALTKDGRLLLASPGLSSDLIEFCSETGREVNRWQQPKQPSSRESDSVLSVAALGDRRAAVGLLKAKVVVLLRRSEEGGSDGAKAGDLAWIEDRRLDQLQWPPQCLSAHGDVLAVCDGGRRLQLMSVSSGRPLCTELRREYAIGSLAVADRVVVTASRGKVELSGGRKAYVLDAHSLVADDTERLWRHDLSTDDEELWGVCADSTGGCLYAAVQRLDRSNGRVLAVSLVDGSELRHVALSFNGPKPLLPARLSLSDDEAAAQQQQQSSASGRAARSSSSSSRSRTVVLAALCSEPATKQLKTVTLHCSRDD